MDNLGGTKTKDSLMGFHVQIRHSRILLFMPYSHWLTNIFKTFTLDSVVGVIVCVHEVASFCFFFWHLFFFVVYLLYSGIFSILPLVPYTWLPHLLYTCLPTFYMFYAYLPIIKKEKVSNVWCSNLTYNPNSILMNTENDNILIGVIYSK